MRRVETVALKSARWIAPLAAVAAVCALSAGAVLAASRPAVVTTHQTKRGKVLAEANGHSLYMFSSDKTGKSSCSGSCANTWRPDLTGGKPTAAKGSGVNANLLGTAKRSNHVQQVTYKGHPLYAFVGDKKPGQIGGEGANKFGGHWYLVNTAGNPVKPPAGHVCHGICQSY